MKAIGEWASQVDLGRLPLCVLRKEDQGMVTVRRLVGLVVLVVLTTACGDDDDGPPVRIDDAAPATTSAPATTAAPNKASDVAKRYFEAFATDRPQPMEEMLGLSVPDSTAHSYARFQVAAAQARADQGLAPRPGELEVTGDVIRLCRPDPPFPGVDPCISISDFTAAPGSNLLTSFTINGKQLADRIVKGGGNAMAGGARFTLAVGYQSVQSEGLSLVVQVANGPKKISVYASEATYIGPSGRQVKATRAIGPFDVQPSASGSVVITIDNATRGGRLVLEGFDGTTDYEVTLPVT